MLQALSILAEYVKASHISHLKFGRLKSPNNSRLNLLSGSCCIIKSSRNFRTPLKLDGEAVGGLYKQQKIHLLSLLMQTTASQLSSSYVSVQSIIIGGDDKNFFLDSRSASYQKVAIGPKNTKNVKFIGVAPSSRLPWKILGGLQRNFGDF